MATRKLDKEHLEQIQTLQQQYAENANLIGNLSIEKHSALTQCKSGLRPDVTEIHSTIRKKSKLIQLILFSQIQRVLSSLVLYEHYQIRSR